MSVRKTNILCVVLVRDFPNFTTQLIPGMTIGKRFHALAYPALDGTVT